MMRMFLLMLVTRSVSPSIRKEGEHDRCEGSLKRIEVQRIIDADIEGLRGKDQRAAACAMTIEGACPKIDRLSRRQPHFKLHNLLLLFRRGRRGGLRMPKGRIDRLMGQIREEIGWVGRKRDRLSPGL